MASNGMVGSLAGKYVFRFNGFSMAEDVPYYIVGVGKFALDENGGLTGSQKTSITLISGQGASLANNAYTLSGSWTMNSDGTGTAKIVFQSPAQTLTGTFDLVAAGGDRFWMISSGATVAPQGGELGYTADEVVSGEAVKIG
jgi:hypothetical protein